MADFMIHFLFCNLCISIIIGILIVFKRIFRKLLTSRMQYSLWFLLLGMLAVPFIPVQLTGFPQLFSWLESLKIRSMPNIRSIDDRIVSYTPSSSADWMNDFALSVGKELPSSIGMILCSIWIAGILLMLVLMAKSMFYLHTLKASALPLQNKEIRRLYHSCLDEMGIKKENSIYSTAFLKSPISVGFLKPCIYLPIHLISDYHAVDMRYILLHELQHYKHKDAFANYVMNIVGVCYWFNPAVWYALSEMRSDREAACDISVLKMLKETEYKDYGNTLINFAEKVSHMAFPFISGISGSMKQMKRRVINIASYKKQPFTKKLKGITVFMLMSVLLLGTAPILSTYALDTNHYQWKNHAETISILDLSSYFNGYDGSFVLYDTENDTWSIYDMEHAILRTSPNSTYKIYNALFGLEEDVITPDNSFMEWDKEKYPFDTWNDNQDLYSAMKNSVNWYFQTIDEQLGTSDIKHYIHKIGYGNENICGDFSSYWMESSLKISPVEQVRLLRELYDNSFGFALENVDAVKNSIYLSSSGNANLYGKTGTGCINGRDVNGWFIGYVETPDCIYFFALNIGADSNAAGNKAADITMSILSDLQIW